MLFRSAVGLDRHSHSRETEKHDNGYEEVERERTSQRFNSGDRHGELEGEGVGGRGKNDGWEGAEDYLRASGIWFIDGIFGVFPLRCHVGSTKEGNCWRIRTDDSTAYTVPAIHEARIPIPLAPRSLLDKPRLSDVSKCSEV